MASIGDVFMQLLFQDSQLVAEASRAGTKAGDTAGAAASKSMGQRLKGSLGTLVSTGVGAALGAGFAIATKGAEQLDAATQRLIADTGLTGDAAAQAKDQIASLYRNNLQGFDQIGAALSKVHTDLGLTGQAAGDAAEHVLKFSTATGQDAADSVTKLDDIMDNWNVSADQMSTIMDKLVVSHQKWGGELAANETTLAKIAPAMKAANFSIDDGIALLGLFGAKGLDSERAAAAFSKALTKVKSPAELKKLITDIEKEPNAFKRAGLAADLFGAKAGAQLANALGNANLDDYKVSLDEAAGATDRAAQAVQSGFGAQFQLILHNAGGALAEFGSNFGPLLLVGAQIGPKFATAIASAFGGIAGLLGPKLIGLLAPVMASTGLASGTALGTAIAAAIPLGLAALAAIPVALTFTIIGGDLQKQTDELTTKTQAFAAKASLDELKRARQGIAEQLAQTQKAITEGGVTLFGGTPFAIDLFGSRDKVQKQLDVIDQQIAAMEPKVAASAQKVAAEIPKAIYGQRAATLAAGLANGIKVTQGLADGIHSARQKPLDAFNNLVEMLKHPLSMTNEFKRLGKQLVSKELAQGLVSADPEIRAAAREVQKDILTRMGEMKIGAGIIGKDVSQALADGLKSKNPQVQANARLLQAIITNALGDTHAAYEAGVDAGTAYAKAVAAAVKAALKRVLADILAHPAAYQDRPTAEGRGGLRTNPLPPSGGAKKQPQRAFGGAVSAMSPTWVGEHGKPELYVPRASGTIVPLDSVPQSGGTTNITVPITGLIKARDPFEIATQLRRLGSFGVLTPKVEPA